jgi:hypothetical protein
VISYKASSKDKSGANVILDQRAGVRLFLRVAGDLTPALSVKDLSASYSGTLNPVGRGTSTVTFTVANTGNVKLGARAKVTVAAGFGPQAVVDLAEIPLLLPGNSVSVTAEVPDVWPLGLEHATVDVEPLALKGEANPAVSPISADTTFWAIPWMLIAILALAIGAVVYLLWRRRWTTSATGKRSADASPTRADQPVVSP